MGSWTNFIDNIVILERLSRERQRIFFQHKQQRWRQMKKVKTLDKVLAYDVWPCSISNHILHTLRYHLCPSMLLEGFVLLCVVFCRSLFVFLDLFHGSLYRLSFFHLSLLITTLVSSTYLPTTLEANTLTSTSSMIPPKHVTGIIRYNTRTRFDCGQW